AAEKPERARIVGADGARHARCRDEEAHKRVPWIEDVSNAILHVTIRGRVHGVGYRAWVEDRARASRLEGWVRNRRDGSVEAVFAGPASVVAEMIAHCRHGPPSARVEAVLNQPTGPELLKMRPAGEAFSVLPTV